MTTRKHFWLFLMFIPALLLPGMAFAATGIDLLPDNPVAFRGEIPTADGDIWEVMQEAVKAHHQRTSAALAVDEEKLEEDEDDAYEWHRWGDDDQDKSDSYSRFHGMGGFMIGYHLFSSDDLDALADLMGVERLDAGQFTMGGFGMGYVGRGWYIGGGGFGGYTRSTGVYTSPTNEDSYNRELGVGIGGGGFMVEYAPLMLGPVNIGAGTMIGGGGVHIRMIQDTGIYTWDEISEPYASDPGTYDESDIKALNTEITKGFFLFQPYLTARTKVLSWMGFSASVGYTLGAGEGWYFNESEMKGEGPDLDHNDLFYRFGIIFGG